MNTLHFLTTQISPSGFISSSAFTSLVGTKDDQLIVFTWCHTLIGTLILNILWHFKCFYNVLSHWLCLKYCSGCLIWKYANGQNLHFVKKYFYFYYFERWSKYLRLGNRWKIDMLVLQFYGCLPSKSSSRSRDWKLWIHAVDGRTLARDWWNENSYILLACSYR